MDAAFEVLSDEELVAELTTWAGRLALIAELDEREVWARTGVLSCAHWVSWRLGWTAATARERVRVARALRGLPLLTEVFGQGRVSYAQVRALTRVATSADEQTWVELARHTTAAQLEKAVRGVARSRKDPEQVAWADRARVSWDEDGTLVLTLRIAPAHAPQVLAALEAGQQQEQAERDATLAVLATELAADVSAETPPEPYEYVEPPFPELAPRDGLFAPRSPRDEALLQAWHEEVARRQVKRDAWRAWEDKVAAEAAARELPGSRATLADGLVRVLTRPGEGKAVKVSLLIDPLSGWARTERDELLPPSTLRAVLKTLPGREQQLPRVRPLTAADLTRHDQGRRSRVVSGPQRTLLGQLDGECCRFPGCTRTRKPHAHHVRFWSVGGPTDLAKDKHELWYRARYDAGCGVRADQFRPQRHRARCRPATKGLPGSR
jgi:hypothetical protein